MVHLASVRIYASEGQTGSAFAFAAITRAELLFAQYDSLVANGNVKLSTVKIVLQ